MVVKSFNTNYRKNDSPPATTDTLHHACCNGTGSPRWISKRLSIVNKHSGYHYKIILYHDDMMKQFDYNIGMK